MPTACGANACAGNVPAPDGSLAEGPRLAAELFAGAPRDVLPLVGRIVLRRLARARVARGAAIVLAGLRDAVALLGFLRRLRWGGLRRRGLREPHRDEARERRLQDLVPGAHG